MILSFNLEFSNSWNCAWYRTTETVSLWNLCAMKQVVHEKQIWVKVDVGTLGVFMALFGYPLKQLYILVSNENPSPRALILLDSI